MTDGDRDRVITAEVIAKAWKDGAYRDRLLADPNAVFTEAGVTIPAGTTVKVLPNSENVHHIVIPAADRWAEVEESFFSGLRGLLPLPAGVELRIVQNTDTLRQMVLPVSPDVGEMSEEDLMSVAGGGGVNANGAVNVNEGVNVNDGVNINVGASVNAGLNANAGIDVTVAAIAVVAT